MFTKACFALGLREFDGTLLTDRAKLVTLARRLLTFLIPRSRTRLHADAIHGTWGDAKFAATAVGVDDGMHLLGSAKDRVDRTCGNAKRAADAKRVIDQRHLKWLVYTA